MKFTYKVAANAAELDTMIANAIESANTMKKRVQVAAVAILAHAEKHGDYSRADTLVEGLGNGVNGIALVAWFVEYGGLRVNEDERKFDGWQGAEYIREKFDDAKNHAWFEFKPQNPWAGYNLEEDLQKVVAKHTSMMKKLSKMPEDSKDREKFHLKVSNDTIQKVLGLVNMEAVLMPDETDDAIGPEGQAAELQQVVNG